MVWVYFDASALVKRYSSEDGTELVNELFHRLPVEQMTCAMIGVLVFWSCDKRLLRAAKYEGVEIFDPEAETMAQLQAILRDF